MADIVLINRSKGFAHSKEWEHEHFFVLKVLNGFCIQLSPEEIELITSAAIEAECIKPFRNHKIYLTHKTGNPRDESDWYEVEKVKLMPDVCERCYKKISEKDSDKIHEAGELPFCSPYCAGVFYNK